MSFNNPVKSKEPIFDTPPEEIFGTGFAYKRATTIVGRPVFSEKNIPIKPSTDWIFRKCYSLQERLLYKVVLKLSCEKEQTIQHLCKYKVTEYLSNSGYFLPNSKLRQKYFDPIINPEIPNEINILKEKNYEAPVSFIPKRLEPDYSKTVNLEPFYTCYKDDFIFNSLIYLHTHVEKAKIINKTALSPIRGELATRFNIAAKKSPSFIIDFTLLNLQYFTVFNSISKEIWQPIKHKEKSLDFALNLKLTQALSHKKESCHLISTSRCYNELVHSFIPTKEALSESESFAQFYITANQRFQALESFVVPVLKSEYYSSISIITKEKQKNFSGSNSATTFPEKFSTQKDNKQTKRIKQPWCHLKNSFLNFVPSEPDSSKSKAIENNIIRRTRKTKQPRLALKLKLNKSNFIRNRFQWNLINTKSIPSKPAYTQPKKLNLDFEKITFVHKSPKSFSNQISPINLKIKTKFLFRTSRFFNKSPKHANYSYKQLHKILYQNSFKFDKKFRFAKSAYIQPKLKYFSLKSDQFSHLKSFSISKKINYSSKIASPNILSIRTMLTSVLVSDKFRSIGRTKNQPNNFNKKIRINPIHLKKLSSLITCFIMKDLKYHADYLKPQKRIFTNEIKLIIFKSGTRLKILKNNEPIYTKLSKATDNFISKVIKTDYSYAESLPNQITKSFELNLTIIGIKNIDCLVQKNIIPPPGWRKLYKKYVCKLRLGPYPFGFPQFTFSPPLFTPLTTRDIYNIKDYYVKNIYKETDFILTKARLYLPELSMKQPRRLLHNYLTAQNSPKEFYVIEFDETVPKQNQPKKIEKFNYSWSEEKCSSWKCGMDNRFSMFGKFRDKRILIDTQKLKKVKYVTVETKLGNINEATMPKIKGFLLKSRPFKAKRTEGLIIQSNLINDYKSLFGYLKCKIGIANLCSKNYICQMEPMRAILLHQSFTPSPNSIEFVYTYMARFRSFLFPYVPDSLYCLEKKERYAPIQDYGKNYICRFQEDFRLSQFDFETVEINSFYSNSFETNQNVVKEKSFKPLIDSKELLSNLKREYLILSAKKLHLKNVETPEQYRHLISPRFFRAKEFYSYKYKMRGLGLVSLKYAPMPNFYKETYSYFSLKSKLPQRLDSASYHWVILLKKLSESILDQDFYYTFDEIKLLKGNLTPIHKSESLVSEKYKESNSAPTKSLRIQSNLTFNEILGEKKEALISNFNEEIPLSSLSLKYNYLDIGIANKAKEAFRNLKSLDFIIQRVNADKGKVIEFDKSISKKQKDNLSIKGRKSSKPEGEFKLIEKAKPRRSDFSSFFFPDFLDMPQASKSNKMTKLCN